VTAQMAAAARRALGYARLSQDRKGTSPNCQYQDESYRAYAEDRQYELVGSYWDDDISASKFSTKPRPGYNNLLASVQDNAAEVMLATEVSRIFRRVLEVLEFIEIASNTTLRWIETTNGRVYDLRTASGVAALIAEVNNAALEVGTTSERVKRVTRAKAREGKFHGGMRPYGYDKDGVTVRLDEARVICEAVEAVLAGQPVRSIVRALNERGVPTSTGKLWTDPKLKAILTSSRLIGVRTHLGQEYPAVWPALISREDFEQVRLILQAGWRGKKQARTYLLTGFLYCGNCGECMNGGAYYKVSKSHGEEPRRSYRCYTTNIWGAKHGCGKLRRMADPVELLVTDLVLRRYSSPKFAAAIKRTYQDSGPDELSTYLEEAQGYRLKIQEIEDAYKAGRPGMDIDTMLRIKLDLEEELEKVNAKIARHSTGRILAAIPAGKNVRAAWDRADIDQRRALIGLIVKQVVIMPGRPGRQRWHHRETDQTFVFDPERVVIEWKF
jgi:site-specific DNA recombinase